MARTTQPQLKKRVRVSTDEKKIEELLTRGVAETIVKNDLRTKLFSGKQLRIKLGIDPTSANVHIGRAVPLLKLRDFEELGHQVVLIVGDFTGVIGDTSDKESERPMLDHKTINAHKKAYFSQAGNIISLTKAELRYNSEWLKKLRYGDIGMHADCFSVADFIARENIARRLKAGTRVSLREVLYPLMQGYDSVAIRADVELGGTDQKFNLLAGRTLQERFGQDAQNILMNPLIHGLDGRKMSSSWGNVINLTAEPSDMYGKVMSMADASIIDYFTYVTRVPLLEISKIKEALASGMNPKEAKMKLAREVVTIYHSAKKAALAEDAFVRTFSDKQIPENIPVVRFRADLALSLVEAGVVASKSELTRLFKAGAVRNAETGEKLMSFDGLAMPTVLKIGKRTFVRLTP
jgi:tyrosyl-tRNA synthetase